MINKKKQIQHQVVSVFWSQFRSLFAKKSPIFHSVSHTLCSKKYHDEERKFDIAKSGMYSRGDVIKVNLGFNIGNELGGLH